MRPDAGCRVRERDAGFSLIEIVVVISIVAILAGAGANVALRSLRGNLGSQTRDQLEAILVAMIGDQETHFGYLGDMGELPDTALTQLIARGVQPAAIADPTDGILSGYNGPYIIAFGDPTDGFVDAWASTIQYTPGTAQLTSLGPDRALGTADDIVFPSQEPVLDGAITVVVRGILASGGLANLRNDEASVQVDITRASDNTRASTAVSYTGAQGSGIWRTDANVHQGYHGVIVTGLDATGSGGRDYSGSLAREIVAVSRGPAFLEIYLEES